MGYQKTILVNELMKEIISIRIDTLWKMIGFKKQGILPAIDDEGATGKFDNKGAIFIPGGLVYQDVDERCIRYKARKRISASEFRKQIRSTMRFDNATLLYPDGIAASINLDSGFFSKVARRILTYKKAAYRRKKSISKGIVNEIGAEDIIRSHCPPYMNPPYGARTRISTCISTGLVDPPMFFAYCRALHNLSSDRSKRFAEKIDQAVEPAVTNNGKCLYPPAVVVCHDTRYKANSYTGLTRILGIGKFGEFATLTTEDVTRQLVKELKRKGLEYHPEDRCAEHKGIDYVMVLRSYAPTNPGKRSLAHDLHVISPHRELGLDVNQIGKAARKRYRVA
jgi:hypothetical protein